MTIEMLEQERNLARKNGNSERLLVLNDIIAMPIIEFMISQAEAAT